MSKNTRGAKEFTREQRLINENKNLKKELAHLRKQIARLDVDRYDTVKQMCSDYKESERFEENAGKLTTTSERLEKEWACHKPKCSGHLQITLFNKISETWYFRSCTNCNNRTKSKRYGEEVRGIIKNGDAVKE